MSILNAVALWLGYCVLAAWALLGVLAGWAKLRTHTRRQAAIAALLAEVGQRPEVRS
jgi:hypothetical protein